MFYKDLLQNISKKFDKSLEEISTEFNFDLGDEFEIAPCKILQRTLPTKFGICRGFVTDGAGNSAGDDIIVYDQTRFPTIRLLEENVFAQKEKIPIEAVYAYLEAKHTININGDDGQSLDFASNQVSKVKAICNSRSKTKPTQISPYVDLSRGFSDKGFLFSQPAHLPSFLNPLYTIVFARNVRRKKGEEILSDKKEIENLLSAEQIISNEAPDLFVLGKNHLIIPFIDHETIPKGKIITPFYLPGKSYYEVKVVDGIAYSIALALLMATLDWIYLGAIPWNEIISQLLNERKL